MIQKPKTESVLDEIHRVRREISDRFHGDIAAIAADANMRAIASGRPIWNPSDNNPMHLSDGENAPELDSQLPPSGDR